MKAHIDLDKCSGHARCYQVDPDLFDIDASGYALRAEVDLPSDAEAKGHEAVAACPERAIALVR
ncbi:ferredoxin [Gordonia sp. KTR9]|uniref:ferredoxin n=1 Tax=Gordonia sp. KTR9 TaxID=337191 RepID=UPI00027DDE95|nr:ferredoxin [Gordonia sp. KTR9]AFR49456.1 Ferredoxin [Gordonia sp. KTR9]